MHWSLLPLKQKPYPLPVDVAQVAQGDHERDCLTIPSTEEGLCLTGKVHHVCYLSNLAAAVGGQHEFGAHS